MADDKTVIDIDALSDEDFLKLEAPTPDASDTEEKTDEGDGTEGTAGDTANAGDQEGTGESGDAGGDEGTGGDQQETELTDEEKEAAAAKLVEDEATETARVAALSDDEKAAEEATAEEEAEAAKVAEAEVEKTKKVNDDKETLKLAEKAKTEETDEEKTAREAAETTTETQAEHTAFFEKMSAPFKADGKEIQIRTPEEGIRLMQMGVNYSKRMQEMKPLRATHAMLEEHGLNDQAKLNELIDLSKGSKKAIQKYLKQHNIDPLDLDMDNAGDHSTPNYQSDPKDLAFQDAIDNTLLAPGGKELLGDINSDWDTESKEALRENPSIFGKLLEQKDAGVYDQIQKELLHQRNMGYLADVPILQAYEQVGNAMKKAGVFDEKPEPKKTGLAPLSKGSRKSPAPKTPATNPDLSSSKTPKAPAKVAAPIEPDYLSMTDEAFMNLAPPG